jgi:hypothetical protein
MFANPNPGGSVAAPVKPKGPGSANLSDPFAGGYTGPDPTVPTTTSTSYQTTTPQFPGVPAVLAMDPNYQQLLSLDKAASAEDIATANRNMGQMRAYYGSDADPLTVLGRIYDTYQQNLRSTAGSLAAHGMLNSGQTGFMHGRIDLGYQQQEFDAKFKLQQYIQGIHDSLRANARQRAMDEWAAQRQAAQDWITNNPPTTVPVVTTTPNPGWSPITDPSTGQPVINPDTGDVGYVPDLDQINKIIGSLLGPLQGSPGVP